ncbi:amino acid permease [Candidatus Omnitrophota bacterium]
MPDKLKRELTFIDIYCLAAGAMISSGIFILPGLAFAQAGPFVFVSYGLAGFIALLGTLSVIELATAMPQAGGDYFFITRSLGPLMGTISSLLSWTALCLKSAFAIFGIAEIIYLTTGIPILFSSLLISLCFVVLNILGVKESVKLQVILVFVLFSIMGTLCVVGVPAISLDHFSLVKSHGINPILMTAGIVFISFGGLLNVASVAGEVKDPVKTIPQAMLFSVITVTILYMAILIVTVGVIPGDQLSKSLTPIADVGKHLFGTVGYVIVSIGALLAFITTANAGMLSASRYPLALSQDKLFPKFMGKLTKKNKTPVVAVGVTGVAIFLYTILDLSTLVKLGSVVILTLYILINVAVIILREGNVQNYRPAFKVPLYPWTNIAGIVLFALLIFDMGLIAVEESIVVIVIAIAVYVFYGKKRHSIEYALVHLIERVIDKKLANNNLEEELKHVLIDRDELKIDRFHELIEKAQIIDIDTALDAQDLFKKMADVLSPQLGLSMDEMYDLFVGRESAGSTAITPFVAIPHIIIPGEEKFMIVAVRSEQGVHFSDERESVKAIFVLLGSEDERTFHLQALASIAQIVHNKHFEKRWLAAKNEQQLRHVLLLGERMR